MMKLFIFSLNWCNRVLLFDIMYVFFLPPLLVGSAFFIRADIYIACDARGSCALKFTAKYGTIEHRISYFNIFCSSPRLYVIMQSAKTRNQAIVLLGKVICNAHIERKLDIHTKTTRKSTNTCF